MATVFRLASLRGIKRPLIALPFAKQSRIFTIRCSSSQSAGHSQENIDTSSLGTIDDLPGPGFFANLTHLKNGYDQMFQTQLEFSKKYGPIFIESLYGKKFVVISDPKLAEKVYRAETKWPYREFDILTELNRLREQLGLPKILIALQGEEWAKLRKIIGNQMLPPVKLKTYFEDFNEVAQDAVKLIECTKDSTGVIENIDDLMTRWSVESIGMFAFGQRTGLLEIVPNDNAIKFLKSLKGNLGTAMMFSSFKWLKYIYRSKYKRMVSSYKYAYETGCELTNKVVTHIKNAGKKGTTVDDTVRKSFVYYLLSEDSMPEDECVVHAVDAYAAGTETATSALAWLMYYLGTNAEQQEKLAAEVDAVTNKNISDAYKLFQNMPYLRACIKEAQRMAPSSVNVPRNLEADIVLNGFFLPKNTQVFISNYIMGRNEDLFPEAESFKPERWLRESKNEIEPHPFAMLPFGYGTRSCVGRRIAEAELQCFTYNVLKKFRIEYVGKPQSAKLAPFLYPTEALRFAFYER